MLFIFKTLANNSILLRCFESLLVDFLAFFLLDPLVTLVLPGFCLFFLSVFVDVEVITFVEGGTVFKAGDFRPAFLSQDRFFVCSNFNEVKSMMLCGIWCICDWSEVTWVFFGIESAWSFNEFSFARTGIFLLEEHTAHSIIYNKKSITKQFPQTDRVIKSNTLTAIGFTDFLYLLARILWDLLSTPLLSTRFLATVWRSFAGCMWTLYCISVHAIRQCEQHVDSSFICFLDARTLPTAAFLRDLLIEEKFSFGR